MSSCAEVLARTDVIASPDLPTYIVFPSSEQDNLWFQEHAGMSVASCVELFRSLNEQIIFKTVPDNMWMIHSTLLKLQSGSLIP